MLDRTRWLSAWAALGVSPPPTGVYESLLEAYRQPNRAYHNLDHVAACLAWLDAARVCADRPAEVELALWFHDAVYVPGAGENEARSAAWARQALAGAEAGSIDRIAALILATQHTRLPLAGDPALIADIDLAIFGATPAEFDRYEAAIRKEFSAVPESRYRAARARILQSFLNRDRLYQTDYFIERLEEAARASLRRSLEHLGD